MAFPESQKITSSKLCRIISDGSENRRFCFILGSGASVESGIPSGNTLEMRWMEYLMGLSKDGSLNTVSPGETKELAKKLFHEKKLQHSFDEIEAEWKSAKDNKRTMSSEYYFDIYRLRFHYAPNEGYRYLERIMDPCEPSLGYHSLALMLTGGNRHPSKSDTNLHNLVITTNFDNLVEDALSLYTDQRPLVANHESLAAFIHPDIRRPIIAKVHRGLMYNPFNSPNNTSKLKKEWTKILDYALNAYTPIVVGYGGGDGSLMSALKKAEFRNGIYWCYRKGSGMPDNEIQKFVEKQSGYLVEIEGFDALMMEMGITLFGETISPEETRSHFKTQSDRRMGDYTSRWNELKKIPHIAKILEPISKVEEAEREKREEEDTLTYWDHFNKAYDAVEKGDYNTAVQEYTRAIEKDPNYAFAYNNRGNSYADLGKYDQAIADYNKAIELDPNYAFAYNNRGVSYNDLGKYDQAIANYNKAIELDPNYATAYNNRGNGYANLGKYDQAIADYSKAIELDPNYAKAYNNRGNSYDELGKYDQAIADCSKAIELDPNYAKAYNNRGISYRKLGKYDLAIADYNKAIELDPNYAFAYNNRGNSYNDLGKYDLAIADYSKAIELDPKYANAYNNRAITYRKIGKKALAEADEAKAKELEAAEKTP